MPTPKWRKATPAEGAVTEFTHLTRRIRLQERGDQLDLSIDGVPIEGIRRLDDGQFHTHYFPFRGFPTADELARAFVQTEGQLWVLTPGAKGAHQGMSEDHR